MKWQGTIDFTRPILLNGRPHGVESVSTLPAWQASDESRVVYTEDTEKLWVGTSSAWSELTPGGIAAHTHDDRYYTETELQTSGSASVHWDNLTNTPTLATTSDVTYENLLANGDIGTGNDQVALGSHQHMASAVTYSNTTSGLDATTIQDAIDELSAETGVNFDGITYVSKSGTDTPIPTGATLGTMDNPYLTVQAAINAAQALGGYQIVFVGPGLYTENIVLPPYVALYSYGKEPTRIGTGNTANSHTFDFSSSGGRVFVKNINLRNDGLLIDHPATGAGGVSVWLDNSNCGAVTFNGLGINDYFQMMESCWAFGDITLHSANGDIRDSFISGSLIVDDTGGVDANGDGRYGVIDVKGTEIFTSIFVTGAMYVRMGHSFAYSSPLTIDGALALFEYDVVSGPDSFSILNGATVNRLSDARDLQYDNSTSGLVAEQVQAAIDEVYTSATTPVLPLTTGAPGDSPATGTTRFDENTNTLYVYNGTSWVSTVLS